MSLTVPDLDAFLNAIIVMSSNVFSKNWNKILSHFF